MVNGFLVIVAVVAATMITGIGGQGLDTTEVKVYSLQRGLWTAPSSSTFLRRDFSAKNDKTVAELTICYRIRLERFNEYNVHFSYAVSHIEANSILFYNMATEMMIYINNLKLALRTQKPLEIYPETWNHFCHILTSKDYAIYWQGELYGTSLMPSDTEFRLNGTLIIGQEQDSLGGTFAKSQVLQGDIAQLSIWNKSLTPVEIKDLAECRNSGRGNIFSLDTTEINKLGKVEIKSLQVSDFCQKLPQYLVLPERRSVSASLKQCHLLNASMIVPSSSQENSRLRSTLAPFMESCDSTPWKFWLGVTDEMQEGAWIDLNGNRSLKYENFVSPYPYGGSSENCAALLPDGTWADAKCNLKKCSACQIDLYEHLFLRGLCFEDEHHSRFRVEGHVDGRPLFRGYYDLLILWNSDNAKWHLVNIDNTTIASMSPTDLTEYPLGLREWTTKSLICGAHIGSYFNLSLSPCTPHHFMCQSGECIAHEQRCNLLHDCEDGSDEDDCHVVYLSDGYRSHLPPPGQDDAPLQLAVNFTITRFAGVDTAKMSVTVEFQVSVTWLDSRLSFSHLENALNRAVLTKEDISKIWLPQYRLLNLEGGKVQLLEQTVLVSSALNPRLPDINTIKMDLMYPGADNNVTLIQDYMADFACFFEFLTFPFDVQVCNIFLRLPSSYENFVQISKDERKVSSIGTQELVLFSVENIRHGPSWDSDQLYVQFELHCHGSSIFLSFFLPCIFLIVVSWATLFIPWETFTVRSVISVSTICIFYLLRVTIQDRMPVTMAIKFIDIWIFFVVLILFINILIHILVPETITDDNFMRNKTLFMRPAGGAVVITPESSQPSSAKIFTLYRKIILPIVVIVFNIFYWALLCILR